MAVIFGTQFTGNLAPNQTMTWFTHSWNANWNVVWVCVPTSPVVDGPAQLECGSGVSRRGTAARPAGDKRTWIGGSSR
jgi:hypothetical protein